MQINRQAWWLAILVIFIIALGTRIVGLTRMALWGDEACMVYLCQESPQDIIAALTSQDRPDVDVAPPVYFILLNQWFRAFGTSVAVFRGFSLLWGVGAVLLAVWLARILFDRRTALIAGLITALNPFQVWYSQEGRMYTLAAFLAALATVFLIKTIQFPGLKRYWLGFSATALSLVYTQYYGFLFACAAITYLVWHAIIHDQTRRKQLLLGSALTVFFWILAYLPWFPVLILDYTHAGKTGGFPSFFHPIISPAFLLVKLTVYGNEMFIRNQPGIYVILVPIVLTGCFVAARQLKNWRVQVLSALVLLPFSVVYAGSLAGMRIYKSHPFIIFQIPLLVLLAYGLRRIRPALQYALISLFLAGNLWVLGTVVNAGDYVKPRMKDAVHWISERYESGDTVAVVPAFIPNPMPIVGDLLTFRYHSNSEFDPNVIYLVGDTAADLYALIQTGKSFGNHLFLVQQDNPQIQDQLTDLHHRLAGDYSVKESVTLKSSLRGFSLSVYHLKTANDDRMSNMAVNEP